MSVRIELIGWPKGVEKNSVLEKLHLTFEGPGAMFPKPDDEEMTEVFCNLMREFNRIVKDRTGVDLQWETDAAGA